MSNPDHLAKLLQGQDAWNAWREDNPDIVPDLSRAALTERAGIPRAILSGGLDLRGALLLDADLSGASLREADLTYACLEGADLRQADLSRAALAQADLSDSDLTGARLANADLAGASLSRARLGGADLALAVGLTNAQVGAAYCDIETQLPTYLDAADIYKDPDAEAELDIEDDPAEESFAADEAEDDAPEAEEAPERKRALNPYKVLEVTPLATALELRNAYLRLAKKYHPDVNPGDAEAEQRFKDINEAYRRAAARSRKKHEAKRGHSVRFWAAAAAFFLVGAVAASVAVHMISVPRSADLHARSAPEAAPGEAQTVASDRVRDEADELEEKTEAGAKEETEARSEIEVMSPDEGPAASRAAAPIAMSISTAKDDSARAVPEPTSSPVPVAIEEHASLANEPSQPPAASAPPAAPAAVAASEIPVPDPGQPPVVPSPPERETPVESIEPATVTADIRPEPSVPASESPAPEEAAVDEKPATVPPPQRMARLTEEEDKGEDKEAEFKAWQSTKEAGTLAAFRAYLINFPNGRHVGDAHKHLAALESEIAGRKEDEAAWSKAQRLSTRTALVGYLLAYPDGRYTSEAKKKLSALDAKTASLHKEDEAWARARANNSHKAYADYLSAYPKGRYAAQAQETIAAVQSRPQSAAPSPPPIVGASRVDQAADDGQSRRSPRFPSSDEPFIERLPGPH